MKVINIKYLIILFFILSFLSLGLWWLLLLLLTLLLLRFFCLKLIDVLKYPLLRKLTKSAFLLVLIFSIAISIKLLTFDIFKIPSSSMENTLFTNDVIVVNKLKYGPRLPRSPFDIPLVNIGYYFNENAKKRFKGYGYFEQLIEVFSNDKNDNSLLILSGAVLMDGLNKDK